MLGLDGRQPVELLRVVDVDLLPYGAQYVLYEHRVLVVVVLVQLLHVQRQLVNDVVVALIDVQQVGREGGGLLLGGGLSGEGGRGEVDVDVSGEVVGLLAVLLAG